MLTQVQLLLVLLLVLLSPCFSFSPSPSSPPSPAPCCPHLRLLSALSCSQRAQAAVEGAWTRTPNWMLWSAPRPELQTASTGCCGVRAREKAR